MNKKIALLLISLWGILSGCVFYKTQKNNRISSMVKTEIEKQPTITVWIHGTKGTQKRFPIGIVQRFFDCKDGLNHATSLDTSFHHRAIVDWLVNSNPKKFSYRDLFLFGWSGDLNFQAREHAALALYHELNTLKTSYQKSYGVTPKFRLITHSHGGNVALNLANACSPFDKDFVIDELILLACPVQDKTASLIQSSRFKRVYSIYSRGDIIQILDAQGMYKEEQAGKTTSLFSRRIFPIGSHISQVKIKINRRSISHIEFLLPRFVKRLSSILDAIDEWHEQNNDTTNNVENKEYLLSIYTKKSRFMRRGNTDHRKVVTMLDR